MEEKDHLQSFNDESFVLKNLRSIPFYKFKHVGGFFRCLRIEILVKSIFFSKSWKDSSGKSELPPDFHNDKHHTVMEIMRLDDGAGGKHSPNSFERTEKYLQKNLGHNYKTNLKDCSLYFVPNTRNDKEYNFKAYLKNFDRVLTNHSNKVNSYHENYPKCKTCVFLVCDESNAYYQALDNSEKKKLHLCFADKQFVEIIKKYKADYVIWFTRFKTVLKDNGKEIKQPLVCVYDVKHIKYSGFEYNHDKMVKIK